MNFNEFQQQYRLENPIYNYSCRLGSFEASVGAFFLIGVPLTLILGGREGTIAGFVLGIIIYFVFQNANKNFYKSWKEYENNKNNNN
jgi:hypothetical protein